MKKVLSFIISLFLITSLIGCSGKKSTPKSVVSDFSIAMQAFDMEKMQRCLVSSENMEDIIEQDITTDAIWGQFAEWAKSIEFEITDVVEANDSAIVTVKYKHIDASYISQEAIQEYFTSALASAFTESSDSNSESDYWDVFFEKAKSTDLGTTETTVVYDCVKVDGIWKIKEISKDAGHVLTSNALKLILGIADAFTGSDTEGKSSFEAEANKPADSPVPTEAPTATPIPTPTSAPTPTPIPKDPTIIFSPADEYDFRLELFDENWFYDNPSKEGGFYQVQCAEDNGLILIAGDDYGASVDTNVLDQVIKMLGNNFSDNENDLDLSDAANCLVRFYKGRIATGSTILGGTTYSLQIIAWTTGTRYYYACAIADAPFFAATVSELNTMLLSFQTTDEFEKDGEPILFDGFVRGGTYDVAYTNATYWKNSIGTYWVQAIVQVTNPGTIPIYIKGGSIDIEDANGKLVKTLTNISAYPQILLPGESALVVEQTTLDEKPTTDTLNAIYHLTVKKSQNQCLRYEISEPDLKDTRYNGVQMLGRLKNNGSEDLKNVYVVVNLYDENHIPIGQLFDIVNGSIKPGEKIGFTATSLGAPPSVKAQSVAYFEVFAFPYQYQY